MSKKVNKQTAKRVVGFYWNHAKRYPALMAVVLLISPIATLANNLIPPLILARVIDRLSRQDFIPGQPLQSFSTEIIGYALLTFIAGAVLWRIVDMAVFHLEGKILRDIAQKVFGHYINQSADFHANHFGGTLVSGSNKLLGGYIRMADTTVFGVLPLVVILLSSIVILFTRAPLFSVALAIFSVVYVVIAVKVSAPARESMAKHATQESRQTGELADAITNAMAIKSFASDKLEQEKFARTTDKTFSKLLDFMRPHQRQMTYFSVMTSSINSAALLIAVISVVSFDADVATAFLIFSYTATIVTRLFDFGNQSLRTYNRVIGDATDTVDILLTPAEIQDPKSPEQSHIQHGGIKFDEVTFKHKGNNEAIFKNLSLSIKPGEKVGLVGHSGSGKSTFTRLLLRFSDLDKGQIKIDGQNIADITQNDLRRAIAYVPQEPLLFHRSIAENIGYSDPSADQQVIEGIAKKANAAEFIETLPDKYETLVGERGIKLSGGQRQRVAIARAMLKNAPILVLDEATSALDSESEELIQDALWKLMEGRTAIVIAHRLSTIQRMDRILVMDNGKIVEEGTHRELVRQGGNYAKLWAKQSGGFIED